MLRARCRRLYAAQRYFTPKHTHGLQQAALGSQAGSSGGAPPRVSTPLQASSALERIGELRSSADEGQIEILQHVTTDEQGQEHRSWSVMIRGTQKWGAWVRTIPRDMLTNLRAVGQLDSDQLRSVKTAMDMAGIRSDEPVEFIGHSQRWRSSLLSWLPKVIFAHATAWLRFWQDLRRRLSPRSWCSPCSIWRIHAISFLPLMVRRIRIEEMRSPCLITPDCETGRIQSPLPHDVTRNSQAIRSTAGESATESQYWGSTLLEEQRRTRLGITDRTQTRSLYL